MTVHEIHEPDMSDAPEFPVDGTAKVPDLSLPGGVSEADDDSLALKGDGDQDLDTEVVDQPRDTAEIEPGEFDEEVTDESNDQPMEITHDAGLGLLWVGLPDGHVQAEIEENAAYIDEVDVDEEADPQTLGRLLKVLGEEAVRHDLGEVISSTSDITMLDAVAAAYGSDPSHLTFFAFPPDEYAKGSEVELPMSYEQARASLEREAGIANGLSEAELGDYVTDPLNIRSHLHGESDEAGLEDQVGNLQIPKQTVLELPTGRADLQIIRSEEAVPPPDLEAEGVPVAESVNEVRPDQAYRPLELEVYNPKATPEQVVGLLQQLQQRGSGHPIDTATIDRYLFGAPITEIESNLYPSEEYRELVERHASEIPWRGTSDVIWTPYDMVRALFERVELDESDTFCDLGSGYGRVLLYGAAISGAKFTGVELADKRADVAMKSARRHGLNNLNITTGNVRDYPMTADGYFLYRPFSPETLSDVARRINRQVEERSARGKPITVITRGSTLPFKSSWPDREHFTPTLSVPVITPSAAGMSLLRVYTSKR